MREMDAVDEVVVGEWVGGIVFDGLDDGWLFRDNCDQPMSIGCIDFFSISTSTLHCSATTRFTEASRCS